MEPSALATTEFRVTRMHCQSCVQLIEETLLEQAGISEATVDLTSGNLRLAYDSTTVDIAAVHERLAELGYPAASDA